MSPEKQRVAIAEACGWTRFEAGPYDGQPFGVRPNDANPSHKFLVPDYLNDLNAMHEAEEDLPPNLLYNYQLTLVEIMALHMKEVSPRAKQFLFHATAAQRAEAFLKTIGKWEEE